MRMKKILHPILIILFFLLTSIISSKILLGNTTIWDTERVVHFDAILFQLFYLGLFACLVTYLLGWNKHQWKNRITDVLLWGVSLRIGLDIILVILTAFSEQGDIPDVAVYIAAFLFEYLLILVLCIRIYFYKDVSMHFGEIPKDQKIVELLLVILSLLGLVVYIGANLYVWVQSNKPIPIGKTLTPYNFSPWYFYDRFAFIAQIVLLPAIVILFDMLPKKELISQD